MAPTTLRCEMGRGRFGLLVPRQASSSSLQEDAKTKLPRLALLKPASLQDAQTRLYERIVAGARDASGKPVKTRVDPETGGLLGPFNAMLLSPQLGEELVRLADCFRFGDLSIPQRVAEAVILYTVRLHRAEYPFWSHVKLAKAAGLSEAAVEALRQERSDDTARVLQADEVAAVDLAMALLQGSGGGETVSEENYAAAVKAFGERGVFEIVALTGFYSTLSRIVNTFAVPVPNGEARPFESGAGGQTPHSRL